MNQLKLMAEYGADAAQSFFDDAGGSTEDSLMDDVKGIINVVIGLVGLVAVVMMILGGFQYVTSAGDTAKVTKAKNTILYGVIGLIIAVLAFAIVNFVLGQVLGGGN